MKYIHIFSIACLFFSAVACGDNLTSGKTGITGTWTVVKGFRDKRQTGLLNGVFFQFGPDGKMLTNLPNTPEAPVSYKFDKNEIRQNSESPVIYHVDNLSDSLLVLSFEMNNTPFELHLARSNGIPVPEAVPPADSVH